MSAPKPTPPFPSQSQESPGIEGKMDPAPLYKGANYKPADKLVGKVALITGGDSGIGRAVAYHFAREGADVAIAHLPDEDDDAKTIKQEIEKLGQRCITRSGDIGDSSFCQDVVDKTTQELGQLDIVVNNAAMMLPDNAIEEFTDETLEAHYRVNVFSYYYIARAAIPHLPEGGRIINTGSIVGSRGGGTTLYAGTKGATHAFTKTLARELRSRGIRVNGVAPGPVWTPMQTVQHDADEIQQFGARNPEGRPAQPEELAPAYVLLATESDSSYMNGEIIFITGSDTAR